VTKSTLLLLTISACAASTPAPPAPPTSPESSAPPAASASAPTPGGGPEVPDMAAFDKLIATHPTQAAFHAAYPKVDLIEPGTITTDEMRSCCSRYFATLDDKGNVTGGSFH